MTTPPGPIPVSGGGDYKYTLEATVSGTSYYANTNVVIPTLAPPTIQVDGVNGTNLAIDPFPPTSGQYAGDYLDIKTEQPAQFGWTPGSAPPWLSSGTQMVTQLQSPNQSGWTTLTPGQQPPYPQSLSLSQSNNSFANNAQTLTYSVRSCVDSAGSFCSAGVPVNATLTGPQFQALTGAQTAEGTDFRQFAQVGTNVSLNWASPSGQLTPGNFWYLASPTISSGTPFVVPNNATSYHITTSSTPGEEAFYLLSCDLTSFNPPEASCGGSSSPGSVTVEASENQAVGTIQWSVPTPIAFVTAGKQIGTLTLSGSLTCPGISPSTNVCPVTAPTTGIMENLVENGATVT